MRFQWPAAQTETPIVELVSQHFATGERDRMVALFERQVADVQEALGASVLGSFTVAGQPDRFIWMRGFSDMAARRAALGRPNTGAGWPLVPDPYNAKPAPEDEVHLLRAVTPEHGVAGLRRLPRTGEVIDSQPYTLVISEVRYQEWIGSFHLWSRLFLRKAGADPLASFATLEQFNDLPEVPVSRDRTMHVALIAGDMPLPPLPSELRDRLRGEPEILTLVPTARSRLR